MEKYKLIKEIHEFNSQIKRIYELMDLEIGSNPIMEAIVNPLTKVRPALEIVLEKIGFNRAEITADAASSGLNGMLSKFERQVLSSGEESLISSLTEIGEKIANAATRAEGKAALTVFLRSPSNFNLVLSNFKLANGRIYELKAKEFVEGRLKSYGQDVFENAVKLRNKKGADEFYNFCKRLNMVGKMDMYFKDYNPIVKSAVDSSSSIKGFFSSITPERIETFRRVYSNMFTTQKKLSENFKKVAEQAQLKMEGGGTSSTIEYELKKMRDILQSMKKFSSTSPEIIYKGTTHEGGKLQGLKDFIPEPIQKAIADDADGIQKFFSELKANRKVWTPLMEDAKGLMEVNPFKIPWFSDTAGYAIFKDPKTLLPKERLMNFVLFLDARTWDEIYMGLVQRGTGGAIAANTIGRLIITSYVVPVITGSLISTWKAALSFIEFGVNAALGFFDKEVDFVDWNKKGDLGGAFDAWWKEVSDRFPQNIAGLLDWRRQTYLDEVGTVLKNFIIGASHLSSKEWIRDIEQRVEQYTLQERQKLLSDHPELVEMGFTLEVLGDPAKFGEAMLKMGKENHGHINADITDDEINNYIKNELAGIVPSQIKRNPTDKSVEIYMDGNPDPVAVVYKNTKDGVITIK